MHFLNLSETYTREEVHSIFGGNTPFTKGSGAWGLQGVVRIPDRPGDWVFFVTYGREIGHHKFDEKLSEDGVLTWQSQPNQGFADKRVGEWINHDHLTNSIYLFLRPDEKAAYTYLGRLKYLRHDRGIEKPVYFQWQLMDWESLGGGSASLQIPASKPFSFGSGAALVEVLPPKILKSSGEEAGEFLARKADFDERDRRNRQVGLAGEKLVVEFEKRKLCDSGREDLASKVTHVSLIEGDGAGFDIRSFDTSGEPLFIEVKSTRGSAAASFYITPNERQFASQHKGSYVLYRVYDLASSGGPKFFAITGDLERQLSFTPTNFLAQLSDDST